jgi:hypothetical protein
MRITAQSMGRSSYLTYKIAQGNSGTSNSQLTSSILGSFASGVTSSSDDMTSLSTQFNSLKSSRKVLQSYYNGVQSGKYTASSSSTTASGTTSTASSSSSKALADAAGSLSESASTLTNRGTKSLFRTDSEGAYDTDAITNAVQSFVDDYNSTRSAVIKSGDSKSIQTAVSMVNGTSANETMLNKVGITINSDNSLSLNTDKFKSADMSDVKSLFNGTDSYAYGVAKQSAQIKSYANAASSSYSFAGYSTTTGSIIDTLA